MSLSSLQLDAFSAVAREKSFSLAAKKLNITQSALSQRVLNLEQELGSTLFIREASGIRLTELGQRLLRYCHSRESLEQEFLGDLQSKHPQEIRGLIRIAGFSTITQSILIPIVAGLVKESSGLHVEIMSQELRHIPPLLVTGRVDFALLTAPFEKQGIENHLVGYEENILVQSSLRKTRPDVYLDHDEEDSTTYDFFKLQGKKLPVFQRSYLDEINGILEGVKWGIGRAVVPLHLARDYKGLEVIEGYKPLRTPIYLSYYSQAFYTALQKKVIERMLAEIPERLKTK